MTGCVHLVFKVTPNFLRERHPHPSSQSGHPPKWPKFLAIFGAEGKILTPPPQVSAPPGCHFWVPHGVWRVATLRGGGW